MILHALQLWKCQLMLLELFVFSCVSRSSYYFLICLISAPEVMWYTV